MKRIAPDYYCTWLEQGRRWAKKNYPYNEPITAWSEGAPDMVNSVDFFGPDGLAEAVPADLRKDLIFLIDSGWDVPYGTVNAQDMKFGSLAADARRFPETAALPPAEKLALLSNEFKRRGWKGIGIWVAAHENDTLLSGDAQREHWSRKLEESKTAGVLYWKVDWGKHMYDIDFRRMLTELGREIYPELWIEHALVPSGHLNDGKGEGRFNEPVSLTSAAGQLTYTDVFRTYDCTWSISNSVTMGRAACMMELVEDSECTGACILNLESAPLLAVALGGTFGSMAPAETSILPPELASTDDAMDNARIGFDDLRMAVNFRRLVSPCAVGLKETQNNISGEWLTDLYDLPAIYGRDSGRVKTMVPAAITRGMPLPQVKDSGEGLPMLAATAYPGNVYAIASLPRAIDGTVRTPAAEVSFELPAEPQKLTVTGRFSKLVLHWPECGSRDFIVRSLKNPEENYGTITAANGTLVLDCPQQNILLKTIHS